MRAQLTPRRLALGQERGIALIAALMIMLLMSALMIGFTTVVMSDQKYRGIDKDRTRAYYGAQSGLEELSTDLGNLFLDKVAPTAQEIADLANTPPSIPGVTFTAPSGVVAYGVTPTLIPCPTTLMSTCSAAIANGPYQGLIALKKLYTLDAVARTTAGGEAHLTRKVESVAIPVFQFGTFSDVDLSFFAGATFTFAGRVHTNGNLWLTAQDNGTTTITDKVTAVGDIIRARMQNGLTLATANFDGTLKMATAPNTYRTLLSTEGSADGGTPSVVNTAWPTISIGTYNGYMRNGGCPPVTGCSTPARGTGAKPLNLALITVGGKNTDLVRRPPATELASSVLFKERDFGEVSVRILMSDLPADITSLATVTAGAPVRLGDEGGPGAGLTNNWATAGNQPAGIVAVGNAIPTGGVMTPISRSPGVQGIQTSAATAAGAGSISVNLAGAGTVPALVAGSVFNTPATLNFDIWNPLGTLIVQTIKCTAVTASQLKSCVRSAGSLVAVTGVTPPSTVRVKDGPSANLSFPLANDAYAGAGPHDYTLAAGNTTASMAANTFWMQSTADQTWSVVTCNGLGNSTPTAGGAVNQFQLCSGVPQTSAGNGVITTGVLVGQNVGNIGGYIKVEIQKADGTGWQDVTAEVLNWGFADANQAGALCDDPTPNAIIRLQRLRDNGGTCHYSKDGTNGVAVSTNSYDYWPNTIFDTREAINRDAALAASNLRLAGVMHYVNIDVANLNKWLRGAAPYAAGSGPLTLANYDKGYSVYFSDRRNNRADGLNGTTNNAETGEYGYEDVVNPLAADGAPNGTPDTGEDINANTFLDVYGKYPSFLGVRNNLPLLPPGSTLTAANIRPEALVGRSGAMTSRAFLFRRALGLSKGTLTSFTGPDVKGLTIVTENPVYVYGDWNWNSSAAITYPHAATAIIADSVTLLSTDWTDSNSFVNPYNANNRPRAADGWYRVAIIAGKGMAFPWPSAGNPGTTFGTDGGAHNFLRYLELGGGTTNYRGAIATFYYSRQGVGTYKFGAARSTRPRTAPTTSTRTFSTRPSSPR